MDMDAKRSENGEVTRDSRREGDPAPEEVVDVFLRLAAAASGRRRRLQEDKFLVLAAVTAQNAGYSEIADDCLARIREHNADHMLGRHASMAQALLSEEVVEYTNQLREIYPLEKAEYLLLKFRAGGCGDEHPYSQRLQAAPGGPRLLERAAKGRRSRGRPNGVAASHRRPPAAPPPWESELSPLPPPPESAAFDGGRSVAVAFLAGAALGFVAGTLLDPAVFHRIATSLGLQRP
jgi:hypothetical protein